MRIRLWPQYELVRRRGLLHALAIDQPGTAIRTQFVDEGLREDLIIMIPDCVTGSAHIH